MKVLMFLLLYQFQFDVHTKDNWSICYQHLDIENCIQLNETTNLYEILDKLPKVDSIMTYFSDYHDEFMDGAYIGANWMNFNSNCILGDASFSDSLFILKIDGFRIRIGGDINKIHNHMKKMTYKESILPKYTSDDSIKSISLWLNRGRLVTITSKDKKVNSIRIREQM